MNSTDSIKDRNFLRKGNTHCNISSYGYLATKPCFKQRYKLPQLFATKHVPHVYTEHIDSSSILSEFNTKLNNDINTSSVDRFSFNADRNLLNVESTTNKSNDGKLTLDRCMEMAYHCSLLEYITKETVYVARVTYIVVSPVTLNCRKFFPLCTMTGDKYFLHYYTYIRRYSTNNMGSYFINRKNTFSGVLVLNKCGTLEIKAESHTTVLKFNLSGIINLQLLNGVNAIVIWMKRTYVVHISLHNTMQEDLSIQELHQLFSNYVNRNTIQLLTSPYTFEHPFKEVESAPELDLVSLATQNSSESISYPIKNKSLNLNSLLGKDNMKQVTTSDMTFIYH